MREYFFIPKQTIGQVNAHLLPCVNPSVVMGYINYIGVRYICELKHLSFNSAFLICIFTKLHLITLMLYFFAKLRHFINLHSITSHSRGISKDFNGRTNNVNLPTSFMCKIYILHGDIIIEGLQKFV